MAKMIKILMAVVTMVAVAEVALATDYSVGGPSGAWNLQTNFTQWLEGKTFHTGDVLTFTYSPSQHDVLEVTQADYASCATSSPIATYKDGNTTITLSAVGARYFICGFNGHCSLGQKVQIDVVSGSSTPPSPTSGGPTPPSSVPSTPGSNSPVTSPPGISSPNSASTSVKAGAGLVFGLAALLAF